MTPLPIPKGRQYCNGWTKGENVCLVYKDRNGKRQVQQFPTEWYFLVRREDYDKYKGLFRKLRDQRLIYKVESYVMDASFVKIFTKNENLYKSQIEQGERDPKTLVLQWLRQAEIPTYEADLSSLKRLMIDYEIQISDRYRVIYLDIETQDELPDGTRLPINIGAYPILSFSVELSNGKTFFVTHTSEEYILEQMMKFLDACDVVATWNGNGFDIPYIKERMKRHGIWYSWKRIIHVDFFERIHDLYRFDPEWESFTLDYVSKKVCPDAPKFDRGSRSIYSMWREYLAGENEDLKTYNNCDVRALRRINEEEHLLAFMIQLCRETRSFMSGFHKSWLIDSFVLYQGHLAGRPLISKNPYNKKEGKFDGALVLDPKPGSYDWVSVFDFKSLYPNVIRTWNIGTADDTMVTEVRDGQLVSKGATPHADVWYQQERVSILAHAVGMFLDGRASVRTKMKVLDKDHSEYKTLDLQQKVWKILANSTYGILGSPKTRYFDVRLAESITHGGRVCLRLAIEYFQEHTGSKVVYGDTDSTFVQLRSKISKDPEACLTELHRQIHEWLRTRWGCQNPTIELEFEKQYKRLIICGKKHYYGVLTTGKFNGMGMDHKKRSTIPIARKLLQQMFEHLLVKDEKVEFYVNWVKKLRNRVLDEPIPPKSLADFAIQKKVTQPVRDYDQSKSLPIQAQIYEDLRKAGHEVWLPFVVKYLPVIPDGQREGKKDGIALQMFPGSGRELDREHLWNIEIYGKMTRILEAVFPDFDWAQFDTKKQAQRKDWAKRTLTKLGFGPEGVKGGTTKPAVWWKTYIGINNSILNDAQKEKLRNRITRARLDEMELKLKGWTEKRLTLYQGKEYLEEPCKICTDVAMTRQCKGVRKATKYTYRSQLCLRCGHETNEKVGK